MCVGLVHKALLSQRCKTDQHFKMTKEGTFTMTSRVVVVRHLGGLLCAAGPIVSLFI